MPASSPAVRPAPPPAARPAPRRAALAVACALGGGCGRPGGTPPAADAVAAGDAGAAADAGRDAACGLRAAPRGLSRRSVRAAGLDRTYLVYLPASLDPRRPAPLLYVLHGYGMSGQAMFDLTGHAALAEAEQVALVFPDGQGGPDSAAAPWNVGAGVCPAAAGPPPVARGDDFALLDAIEADLAADQCLNPAHAYVTGFSMGGYFAHHAGCMRPGVRAIAPSAGGTHTLDGCANARRPVIIFHGGADPVVPAGCDDPAALAVPGATASATAWARHNGCAATTRAVAVTGGRCLAYDGCPADGQVELCTFDGMGHCWAGGQGASPFACAAYASATRLAWQFFRDHAW